MLVKSVTWCSMTVVAVLTAALLGTAPVSATSDDSYQNIESQNEDEHFRKKIGNPVMSVETGACVEKGALEGTVGVDITNPNSHKITYKIVVNAEEKTVTVAGNSTEYVAFTGLAAGDYTVEATGPHDTKASGSATISECHVHEPPLVTIDSCGCVAPDAHDGDLRVSITNPNDYAVTYTVRIGWRTKDVFVDSRETKSVSFNHLRAGNYEISISGDDCTHLCLNATVEQCPEEEPEPEQPGQGGGTPPTEEPEAPAPEPVVQTAALPTELPDTSAAEEIAVAAPAQTSGANASSLVLVAIGAPMAIYAVVRRRQLNSKLN